MFLSSPYINSPINIYLNMKIKVHRSIYYFLVFLQLIIIGISILLLLNLFNTEIFVRNSNSSSLIFRILLFFLLQYLFKTVFKKRGLEEKKIFTILTLISLAVIFDGLGNIFGWYEMGGILGKIQYDDIMHLFLPLMLTLSLNILFRSILKKNSLSNILSITSLSFLICIWEIYEYWSDVLFHTTMLGDIHDTLLDMTLGILGGILALLLIRRFLKALK